MFWKEFSQKVGINYIILLILYKAAILSETWNAVAARLCNLMETSLLESDYSRHSVEITN